MLLCDVQMAAEVAEEVFENMAASQHDGEEVVANAVMFR